MAEFPQIHDLLEETAAPPQTIFEAVAIDQPPAPDDGKTRTDYRKETQTWGNTDKDSEPETDEIVSQDLAVTSVGKVLYAVRREANSYSIEQS